MTQGLFSVDEVRAFIAEGRALMLAGDARLLEQLPSGRWIGGTIPYFMGPEGGVEDTTRIFVAEMPSPLAFDRLEVYDSTTIERIYLDIPRNGLALIIVPSESPTHLRFAIGAPSFTRFAFRPLVGWVSGTSLRAQDGGSAPLVFSGADAKPLQDGAAVMILKLPPDVSAEVGIINMFEASGGDVFTFPEEGFVATNVLVNGQMTNFARLILERKLDTRLPLVANYCGARINVSFKHVDPERGVVQLIAPVFRHVEYQQALPIADYTTAFSTRLDERSDATFLLSCNCILNYLYAGLEGKRIGRHMGPMTFGEIAYQLLNQTLVYVRLRPGQEAGASPS